MACNNAELDTPSGPTGDPTEVALLEFARSLDTEVDLRAREATRRRHFHFDPVPKRMSTVDERERLLWVDSKGAPEQLLASCSTILWRHGEERPLGPDELRAVNDGVEMYAGRGLRVLAVADRRLDEGAAAPTRREEAERDLCFPGAGGDARPAAPPNR